MSKIKDNVDFTEEHFIDWDLRVHSHDAFPEYPNLFLPDGSGKNYELYETYCKNFECKCTSVICTLMEEENENDHIIFNYDYTSRKCVEGSIPTFALEIFALGDFNTVLKHKHSIIKKSFQSAILAKKTNELLKLSRHLGITNTVNRNDTCFCGSGKKYKKCCLNL